MKVLDRGPGWSVERDCTGSGNGGGGCGAKLLVEEGDLFETAHTDYGGDRETYVTFRCPQCKKLTDIPPHDVPAAIRRNLKPQKEHEHARLAD
jgi:phage FluMu protein Com